MTHAVRRWIGAGGLLAIGLGIVGCTTADPANTTTAPTTAHAATSTSGTTPSKTATDGRVDLHQFDGTWTTGKFQAVGCAIDDMPMPTVAVDPAGPTVTTSMDTTPGTVAPAWNRGFGCGIPTNRPFIGAAAVVIDGSSVTVHFFDASSCVGTMTSDDSGVNDETAVRIDNATCDGVPAPSVETTLQLDGNDVLIASGVRMQRGDPDEPLPNAGGGGAGAGGVDGRKPAPATSVTTAQAGGNVAIP